MLRWGRRDVFAMSDLKRALAKIEEHALKGETVVLTRHGRPTFALLRLDRLERLIATDTEPISDAEIARYDAAFERGGREIVAGQLDHWSRVRARIEARLRRERAKSKRRARGQSSGSAR